MGVCIKPYLSSYLTLTAWGSTHFAIPLTAGWYVGDLNATNGLTENQVMQVVFNNCDWTEDYFTMVTVDSYNTFCYLVSCRSTSGTTYRYVAKSRLYVSEEPMYIDDI